MKGQWDEDVDEYCWAITQTVRRSCCGRSGSCLLKFSVWGGFTLFLQVTKALRESSGMALLCFLDLGTRKGEGSASRPGRFLLLGKTQYPLYRRMGEPQGRSGQVQKISPPPGLDPRTVQPVASRYTDWATGPMTPLCININWQCVYSATS
jgi:hypothetical protein